MNTSVNRQINIYVNSGDAEKAYERLTNQNTKLNKSVSKNTEELKKLEKELAAFSGAKSSDEFKKLKQNVDLKRAAVEKDTQTMKANNDEMSRIQRKINGELSPSYNDLSKRIATLTRELKAMSREDGGWKDKIEQLRKARTELDSMNQSMNKTTANYSTAFGGAKGVAIGTLAANAAMSFVDRFKTEINQGMQDAKVFEGVKEAFDRLDNPALLDQMRHAVKGTVNDLEMMKLAVQANNFEIPLNQLATFFEFAKKRAQDTGQEVDFLVQSIITGIGRKSPLILDNLGISAVRLRQELKGVSAESANIGDVAAAVGKIIQEESAKAGAVTDTYSTKLARNKAQWENTRREIATNMIPILDVLATGLSKVSDYFAEVFGSKASENIKREQTELNILVDSIRDSNTSNEVRVALISELNKKYPDFVKLIDVSTASEADLKIAMDKTNKEYEKRFLLASLSETQEKYTKKITESIAAEVEARKMLEKLRNNDLNFIQTAAYALKGGTAFDQEIEKQKKNRLNLQDELKKEQAIIVQMAKDLNISLADIGKEPTGNTGNRKGSDSISKEEENAIKKRIEKQKEFIERMKELRRDYEISEASQDEKELEAVRVKYAKMVEELDKAFPKMTSQAKAFRDEIYLMQIGALSATMDKQEYNAKLKASDEYYRELQTQYKAAYAKGDIDKKEYDRLIQLSDIALKNARVSISEEFSGKNKQAEQDRVTFAKEANKIILDDKIKESEDWERYLDYVEERENNRIIKGWETDKEDKQRRLEQAVEYASMTSQLLQGFFSLSATDYSADLNREQRANDRKKQEYKRMLDSKRISQAKYNQLVEKADEESAKKQNEIKRKQFEADKQARKQAILGDTAAGIMRAVASSVFPANLPAIAFATLQGFMQMAAVDKTKFQEMKSGGILNGPSHSEDGLKVYNPKTGMIEAELEGGESHLVLSKPFTENNADIIPPLLEASRTGAKLFDTIPAFNTGIPRMNTTAMIETVRMASGGIMNTPTTPPATTTISKDNTAPAVGIDIAALSAINENIVAFIQLMDSKVSPLNYELLAKNIAEYFKKYGVMK